MQDLNDKITGNSVTAAEWNQMPSEIQNVIEGLGQTLSGADLNQLGKSIAGYVANGNYYTDSGAADAYVLSKVGLKQTLPAYTDGARFTYVPDFSNTGASTANAAALGAKNIYLNGAALTGGEIVAGQEITIVYDSANDRFNIEKRTLMKQDWTDGAGAADDKTIRFIVDGGVAKFQSLTDALGVNQDNILIMDLGTGTVTIAALSAGTIDITGSLSNSGGDVTISDSLDLTTGNEYKINAVSVLNATTLGSSVVNSSLTSLGILSALTVNGSPNITTGNSYNINAVSVLNATTLGSTVVNSSLTSLGILTGLSVGGAAGASAIVQIDSTTKGFLPPRMTTAERDLIGTPAAGLLIYNSTVNGLNIYNGSSWITPTTPWGTSGSDLTYAAGNIIVNTITSLGVHATYSGYAALWYTGNAHYAILANATDTIINANGASGVVSVRAANSDIAQFTGGGGQQIGSPTGADKGAGTLNLAGGLFVNGNRQDIYSISVQVDGWVMTGSSYTSKSFNPSETATSEEDIFISPDGKFYYVLYSGTDEVFQYEMATPWDISSAVYVSKSYDFASEENTPLAIFFKPDGTKMYMVGQSNDTVYQYSLSTPWDVSTGSYDSVSISIAAVVTNPRSVWFSSDGTKMYAMDSSDTIHQYTLSTPWVVSSATSDSKSFATSTQETLATSFVLKRDGTKMYAVGTNNQTVYQYSLSTAYDISTASYDSVSFSVSSQDTAPIAIWINDSGTRMYMHGTTNATTYQYDIPIASVTKLGGSSNVSVAVSGGIITVTHNIGTTNYSISLSGFSNDALIMPAANKTTNTLQVATVTDFDLSLHQYT